MSPQSAVVVGAGMVGLSTAWFLQEHGVEVTVIDASGVAAGSSWGNAGWLAPALTLPLPEPAILATGIRETLRPSSPVYVPLTANPRLWRFLIDFARHCTPKQWHRALAVFNQANALALGAFDELAPEVAEPTRPAQPFLAGFASAEDRRVLVEEFDKVNAQGGKVRYSLVEETELRRLEPALGAATRCGILIEQQRFINPGRFVHALAESVRARGGRVLTGRPVTEVSPQGGRIVVRTETESHDAHHAVIASGTWLNKLARPHGVRTIVQAGRGYSFTVRPERVPAGPIYFPTQRVACTPLGDGGLRVAGMMEFRGPGAPLDPRRVRAIIDAASPMLTGVDWSGRTDEWVGSRPCTADGLPLVGRTRTPGVHVAGGHGMWGIALGPLTGKLLAEQIVTGEGSPLLEHFDPLR